MPKEWITKNEMMNRIIESGCKLQRDTLNVRLSNYTVENMTMFTDYVYNKPRRAIVYDKAITPKLIEFFTKKKRNKKCKKIKSQSADQK